MISSCWIAWQERIANVVSAIENATLVRQLECNKWNFPVEFDGPGSRFRGKNKFYIWGLLIGTALMLWITWNLESSSRGLGTVVNSEYARLVWFVSMFMHEKMKQLHDITWRHTASHVLHVLHVTRVFSHPFWSLWHAGIVCPSWKTWWHSDLK